VIGRRQLPVLSPVTLSALTVGAAGALGTRRYDADAVVQTIRARFGTSAVALTDSGTSALVLAMRLAVGDGGAVALPGYGCYDLTAAAVFAGVRVLLYDLNPGTLSPDLDSVQRVLARGARAIVVAHFFGYPADVPSVLEAARSSGAVVIEDAAQAAGGTLHGRLLGSFGELCVLSFGRGKGTTSGGGGALVAGDNAFTSRVRETAAGLRPKHSGWTSIVETGAQWALGRPRLYGLPASLPWLGLGEMVYRAATEPSGMPRANASLLRATMRLEARELDTRRQHAQHLSSELANRSGIEPIRSIEGAEPGFLRFAALLDNRVNAAPTSLGVVRPYPITLAEHHELRHALTFADELPGSRALRDTLVTIPTHGRVADRDIRSVRDWVATIAGAPSRAEGSPDQPNLAGVVRGIAQGQGS
jgi:perosamine synthetase